MLLLASACSGPAKDTASPDYAALPAAIETEIKAGPSGLSTTAAVLISVQGKTVVEDYRLGRGPADALHVWSVSKSVVSALIGTAIGDGLIPSVDDTLADLLPRYRTSMTPEVAAITLRQLMDMTAGFKGDEPASNVTKVFASPTDPIPMILEDGLAHKPGTTWVYSSISAHLVSAVLREALIRADPENPQTVLAYAQQKLFEPLKIDSSQAWSAPMVVPPPFDYPNIRRFGWGTDAGGLQSGCCLLHLRPADMVKIGELYLGDGVWNGQRILPAGWVAESTKPGAKNGEYGLLWYRLTIDGQQVVAAQGRAGQLIAVFPDRQMVIAIGSVETPDAVSSYTDPWTLITDAILPALG